MTTALPTGTLDERPEPVKALRVYYRQSLGEDKQASIPTQRGDNQRLALALGFTAKQWANAKVYTDTDRSGADFSGREDLTRLLAEARPGDTIITWRQSRVGRDMIDSALVIRELVKTRKCRLYTAETGTVPISMDSAEEALMVMVRSFANQKEHENTRKNTRAALRQRAIDGFAAGRVPFGYRTVLMDPTVADPKKTKKRIAIVDAEARIVSRIVAMYLDGRGYAAIAKALNAEGAPSPRGRGWSPTSIWEMLREPRYAGYWTHGERRVVRREGRRVIMEDTPEDEIIRLPHRPELAIIGAEEWARIQATLASRKREMPAQRVASSWASTHPLSGVLSCGECGARMRVKKCHGRRASWSKRYYVCPKRRTGRCGNAVHLPADEVEQRLVNHLRASVFGQIERSIHENLHAEVHRVIETADARQSEANQLRTELDGLRHERHRLVRLAAATDEPIPEVVDALNANQERAKELDQRLTVATRPPIDPSLAERLEATAVAQVDRMREQLTAGEAREVFTVLFPSGLRFKIGSGLWLVEGAASVPTVRLPDVIRIPDAGHSTC
jgi:site-specific DNA recombinase